AARCAHEPDGDLHECGLAGAVRAEEPEELALAHLEVDALQRFDRAVDLREPVHLERRHSPSLRQYAPPVPRGYMEGPAAEEAERRAEEVARGVKDTLPDEFEAAVYGCTEDDPEPHFLGLLGEVDPDE